MDQKNSLLIYVVEDNKIYNRMVCEYLKNEKYSNFKSFESGKDCIKSVKDGEKPDIIIQDYALQDITGIDVLKAVKKENKNTEFVFLTANENMEVAINSIKYGAFDYIVKDNDIALKKVVYNINKISKMIFLRRRNKTINMFMIITISVLAIIVLVGFLQIAFKIFGEF